LPQEAPRPGAAKPDSKSDPISDPKPNLKVEPRLGAKRDSNKDGTLKSFRQLVAEIPKPYLLAVVVCMTVLLSVMEVYSADVTKKAMDSAVAGKMAGLSGQFLLILAVVAIQASSRVARKRLLGRYTEGGLAHLREKTAVRLAFSPLKILEERHSGDYISRETNDLARVERFFRGTLLRIIYQPLTAAGAIFYCLYMDWKLTLITMVITPLTIALAARVSRPMGEYGRLVQEELADLNEKSQDLIHGTEIARVFGLNHVLGEKFGKSVEESVQNAKNMAKVSARLLAISLGIGTLPFLICFGAGGFLVLRGEMSAGSLLAFIMLLNHLTMPFSEFPGLFGDLRSSMTAAKRVLEVFDLPPEIEVTEAAEQASPSSWINQVEPEAYGTGLTSSPLENARTGHNIEPSKTRLRSGDGLTDRKNTIAVSFKSVSFSYAGRSNNVLRDVDLEVGAGEKVAIVGPSGSGKSTLIKLLMGFYRNYQGEIFLLGKPVKAWDLCDLRRNLALVTQDTYLFPGSIRENISFGKLGCSFDEVVAAAKVSHIHEFVMKLPQGYDTEVGELGSRLSGGEKQRIAIARAVIKDAPVLLLDEATSSLDTEVERSILESLSGFLKGRTAIMVTHRPSILRYVDKAFLMDEGTIVESGSLEEILREGDLNAKIYDVKTCREKRFHEGPGPGREEGAGSGF